MGRSSRKKRTNTEKIVVAKGSAGSFNNLSGSGLPQKFLPGITQGSYYRSAAAVSLITFLVYLSSLQNGFVNWDDNKYVYMNPFIRSMDMKFFKWAFFDFYASNWHPLTWISIAIDYSLWELNPLGYHLTNSILHAINTLIIFFLTTNLLGIAFQRSADAAPSELFCSERAVLITGAVVALLFGLHPVHVESVAWVSERKDVLCALFFLLSLMSYIHYAAGLNGKEKVGLRFVNKYYLFALICFLLALLSKPMAVTIPVILLILDWYPLKRIRSVITAGSAFIEKLPFFSLSLFSSIITVLAQEKTIKSVDIIPLSARLIIAAKALVFYLWKIILPVNLTPFYPYPPVITLFSLKYLLPVFLVIGITTVCIIAAKRQKLWIAAWSYYLVTLLPVLGIVQVGNQSMADRYAYLPSLGPLLIIGLIAAAAYDKLTALKPQKMILTTAVPVLSVALLITLSYACILQIGVWKNSFTLWNYVIEKEPGASAAYNNRGNLYLRSGQLDLAIEDYNRAIVLRPGSADAYTNLGAALFKKGLVDKAIEQYRIALKLAPDYSDAYNNLGAAYGAAGSLDDAIKQLQIAVKLNPYYADAYANLGRVFRGRGLLDEAIKYFETAVKLDPADSTFKSELEKTRQLKAQER